MKETAVSAREGDDASARQAAASVATPSSTRTETIRYGAGHVVFAGGRLLRDLTVAWLLGPGSFGMWSMLLVCRQYSNYSDLGFTNGLGRMLPQLLHEGKHTEARRALGAGWAVAMGASLIMMLLAVAYWRLRAPRLPAVGWWGLACLIALMFLDKHYMYASVVLRSAQRVGEYGCWTGVMGLLELVLGSALTWRFGLSGLYASAVLAVAGATIAMSLRQPLRGVPSFDRNSVRALLAPSLTLMGLGVVAIAIHNVDRLAVLWHFGPHAELGQYQLASSLSLGVSQLPYVLLTVLAPRIYRFDGASRASLRRYLLPLTAITAVLSVAVGVVAYLALPEIMTRWLPKYASSASLARLLLLAEVWFAVGMVADHMLVALGRGTQSLCLRCLAIAAGLAASGEALHRGYGLGGVALCMCAVQAGATLALAALSAYALQLSAARTLIVACVPVLYTGLLLRTLSVMRLSLAGGLALAVIALVPLLTVPLWFFGICLPGVGPVVRYLQWSEAR